MVKRKNRQEPTVRQKKVIKTLVANGGSMASAMRKAGYAKKYARNPQKLKKTLSFEELTEKYWPDSLLARRAKQLLNRKYVYLTGTPSDRKLVRSKEIDVEAVAKGLDYAFRIKNKFPDPKIKIDETIKVIKIIDYSLNDAK